MAAKQDLETMGDLTYRMLALIRLRQQAVIQIEENPDLEVPITPEIKEGWLARYNEMRAQLKTLAAGL